MTLYSEQSIRDVAERAFRMAWNEGEDMRDALRLMVATEPTLEVAQDFTDLFVRGLLVNVGDQTGEQTTRLTDKGQRFLLLVLVDKMPGEQWIATRDSRAKRVGDELVADGVRGVVVD